MESQLRVGGDLSARRDLPLHLQLCPRERCVPLGGCTWGRGLTATGDGHLGYEVGGRRTTSQESMENIQVPSTRCFWLSWSTSKLHHLVDNDIVDIAWYSWHLQDFGWCNLLVVSPNAAFVTNLGPTVHSFWNQIHGATSFLRWWQWEVATLLLFLEICEYTAAYKEVV